MLKKLVTFTLSFLMVVGLSTVAQGGQSATDSCNVASSYFTGENLYVFLEAQEDRLPVEMDLLLHNAWVDTASPESMSESKTPASYLFLMDLSTSMEKYRSQITAFSHSLFAQTTQPIQVTVAGFGDRFEILAQALTTDEDVSRIIRSMIYDHSATDVPGGVSAAANYLSAGPAPQGEAVNVVVFTDGVPWPGEEDETEEKDALRGTIVGTPEMIFHSVVFGTQGDREILAALATGTGENLTINSTQDAIKGGEYVAKLVDGLARVTFQPGLDQMFPRFDGQLFFYEEGAEPTFLALQNVRNYPMELPQNTAGMSRPKESFEPEPTQDSAESGSQNPGEGMSAPVSSAEEHTAIPSVQPSTGNEKMGAFAAVSSGIWLVAGAGVVVLILTVARVAVRVYTKGKQKMEHTGIAVKLEVIQGQQKGSQKIFYMNTPLEIGSGAPCQLVWKDSDMPVQSARVFVQDQTVYIESLTSADVYIGGIQIHTVNRLRSGDEITIANTKFCFRF